MLNHLLLKYLHITAALFLGSGLASVYALTEDDFTNTGVVLSAPTQFENNNSNNAGTVLVQPKGLTIEKVADASLLSTPTQAGEVINYTITLDNIGLLALTNVVLSDSIIPAADLNLVSGDTNSDNILDGDETWIFTGAYAVKQTDIDTFGGGDGDIDNTVRVNTDQLDELEDSAEVPITQAPEFTVTKTVDKTSITTPTVLRYTIEVVNTGNQSLTGISLSDTLPDGSLGTLIGPATDTGIANAIDVGETWTYTVTYGATQADIDSGLTLTNSVAVTTAETGPDTVEDAAQTTIAKTPNLQISKSVDNTSISVPGLLSYTVTLLNNGNVTLNNVAVADVMPDSTAGVLVGPTADTGTSGALDVGETWTYTATYNANQSHIDAGADLINTVSTTTDETDQTVFSDIAVTSILSEPNMIVQKSVDKASLNAPGVLNYSIIVENTGNQTLSNVVPIDTLPDGSIAALVGPLNDTGLAGQLDVGESWEYTATYNVSQLQIDQGLTLENAVDVTSDETAGQIFSDTVQTVLTRSPAFTVEKLVDQSIASEPGLLTYEITVTNTGNTSLTDVQLDDTLPDGSTALLTGPILDAGALNVLDVNESWTFIGEYNVTQDDVDAGISLTNTVTVNTAEAGGQSDDATTTLNQAPGISLVKSVQQTDFTAVDDVLEYTLVVTNTGNVVLSDVVVVDSFADTGSVSCAEAMPFILQPAETQVCNATRTVTAADIALTEIPNQASVSGLDPLGTTIEEESNPVLVPMLRLPPLATDDLFVSPVSAVPVTLDGATDDSDANNDLDPTSLNFVSGNATDVDGDGDNDLLVVTGEGTWLVDDVVGTVTFTPVPGFTADPTPIVYTINDATGLVSNEATLSIEYPQTAPIAENDYKQNSQTPSPTNTTSLNLLADNGSGVDRDPENDIDVTSINFVNAAAIDSDGDGDNDTLIVPGEGLWVVDNLTGDVTFTPQAGFLGDPTPIAYTISDVNELVSNEALITIDYPQTAPVAEDDEKLNQPLGEPVTLSVLDNDSDPENNLDPATVRLIDPASGDAVVSLVVPGEGVWTVNPITGAITFTPDTGFIGNPAPVNYSVTDTTGLVSNVATVTVTYEEPAALEGIIWLDSNRDGVVGADEQRKVGWILKIYDFNGNLVATTQTDADGYYKVEGLVPGAFTVEFFNSSGVFMDSQDTGGVVSAGQIVNLPLPVDPGGVVYDSVSREPVAGVTLNMLNGSGELLHEDCLQPNQQSQITESDGLYSFILNIDSHPSCQAGDVFEIEVAETPPAYYPNFSSIIRQVGADSCGDATLGCAVSDFFDSAVNESNCTVDAFPTSNACEVQQQPDAPVGSQGTQYFVEFMYEAGDRNVIFNHLPIDARANDAEILLSKVANKRDVSVGSLVEYTLNAENTKEVPTVEIDVVDSPPANFNLVAGSVRLIRAGIDGEFDTEDDTSQILSAVNQNPIVVEDIEFDPLETIRIKYVLRVGVGVVTGDYVNEAIAVGPNGVASNAVSATVSVVTDPVLEQATLIGKVFNDRDSDGSQDPADATGVALRSDVYGWNSLVLPDLVGRSSVNIDPADSAAIVNMPVTANNAFMVVTREGTRISVDHEGTLSEAHIGAKARGLTGQDIRLCMQRTLAVPTDRQGYTPENGTPEDVLQIAIQNFGINEEGIPGARLATVTGLLIETDAYGRYSIPDVDAGTTGIGQNFVLKVDPATLPQGSAFTTENPYVLRIVNSSLNKINFGVLVPESDPFANSEGSLCQHSESDKTLHSVEVRLGSVFFDTDKHNVREDQRGIVLDIVRKLEEYGGGEIVIEAHTDSRASAQYNLELSERRAATIRNILREMLSPELVKLINVEVNPSAYKEQGR